MSARHPADADTLNNLAREKKMNSLKQQLLARIHHRLAQLDPEVLAGLRILEYDDNEIRVYDSVDTCSHDELLDLGGTEDAPELRHIVPNDGWPTMRLTMLPDGRLRAEYPRDWDPEDEDMQPEEYSPSEDAPESIWEEVDEVIYWALGGDNMVNS